jgi:DNA polymerase-4
MPVSFGGGTSRLVAKLAVERAKPRPGNDATGVYVVAPGSEEAFVSQLALADIPLVGPRFQDRLAKLGMRTVLDVLPYHQDALVQFLGEREGMWLYRRVRGLDDTTVEPRLEAKSISRDETFPADIDDDQELARELLALVTKAVSDMRGDGACARTVRVKLRDWDFRTRQASRTLDQPVMTERIIMSVARSLLRRLRAARRVPARLLGVALSSLAADDRADQLTLFECVDERVRETERDRQLARAVDKVRARFGEKGILPAGLV